MEDKKVSLALVIKSLTLGGIWTTDSLKIATSLTKDGVMEWEEVTPYKYRAKSGEHDISIQKDALFDGAEELINAIKKQLHKDKVQLADGVWVDKNSIGWFWWFCEDDEFCMGRTTDAISEYTDSNLKLIYSTPEAAFEASKKHLRENGWIK